MLLSRKALSEFLQLIVNDKAAQGFALDPEAWRLEINAASDSYDALHELAERLKCLPLREDWPYREPLDWAGIAAESEYLRPADKWVQPDLEQAARNAEAAFLGSVCGCMLGKPIEVDPSLAELKSAGESVGEWPIRDYVSRAFVAALGRRHPSAGQTLREKIACVAADDDIHYTLLGMLLLEQRGLGFGAPDVGDLWSLHIPPGWTWGAERTALIATAAASHHLLSRDAQAGEYDASLLNPGDEMCGAMIRADAYGYACPGNPDLAARLAWKDASFTHVRTGVYAAMFIAATIALSHTADATLAGNERLEIIREAGKRLPVNSRFAVILRDSLEQVAAAGDWMEGYHAIHGRYRQYSHCQVYQEVGTLINTLKFARSVDHGFCIQVCQGNDTDSFGATAGSILGCFFGPGHLDERWLRPLGNTVLHALADLHEYDLAALTQRIGRLPELVFQEYNRGGPDI